MCVDILPSLSCSMIGDGFSAANCLSVAVCSPAGGTCATSFVGGPDPAQLADRREHPRTKRENVDMRLLQRPAPGNGLIPCGMLGAAIGAMAVTLVIALTWRSAWAPAVGALVGVVI